MVSIISVLVVAFLASYGSGFLLYRVLLRFSVLDRPNERSSHSVATVRGGGIVILLPLLVASGYVVLNDPDLVSIGFLGAVVLIAVISFLDDVRSLSQRIRFGAHALTAVIFLSTVFSKEGSVSLQNLGAWFPLGLACVLIVWLVGYANAFNFMDGINGLAGSQAAITSLLSAYAIGKVTGQWDSGLILIWLAIAGGGLGFLPHNFPRASMFMGDIGSVTLGFTLAALSVWALIDVGWVIFVPLCLVHSNFVLDTAVTFLRRLVGREAWWQAHREHFYQRWIRSGASHSMVTFTELALQIIVCALLVVYLDSNMTLRILVVLAVFLIWSGFFVYCDFVWRRSLAARSNDSRNASVAR